MRPTCKMGSAHRAPIVDSTLSGCSALSQTGLAHHTSDIFNIQFSISNIEYWISTIFESQLSVHPSVLSSLTDFTRGADKMGKTLLRTLSKAPNSSLHLAPTSHPHPSGGPPTLEPTLTHSTHLVRSTHILLRTDCVLVSGSPRESTTADEVWQFDGKRMKRQTCQ